MKWLLPLFSFLILIGCGATKTVGSKTEYFGTDFSGFSYHLKDNQIQKIDSLGQVRFGYPLPRVSEELDLDITSPFKTLLFYKDFNLLDVLDDELNLVQTINLRDLNIGWIEALCSDYRGGYWLFSNNTSKLYHYSYELELILEVDAFRFMDKETNVRSMTWFDNKILILTDQDIIVMEGSGVHSQNCPLDYPEADKIYQKNKQLFLIQGEKEFLLDCSIE